MSLQFTYTILALGQPAGLSKEVCLYAVTDWLMLVCQSEGDERSAYFRTVTLVSPAHRAILLTFLTARGNWAGGWGGGERLLLGVPG